MLDLGFDKQHLRLENENICHNFVASVLGQENVLIVHVCEFERESWLMG